jgi:hypothetical protein
LDETQGRASVIDNATCDAAILPMKIGTGSLRSSSAAVNGDGADGSQ